MKNIHYAFASVAYHKKTSFCIAACSAAFLLLSTSLLNLITMEEKLYLKVSTSIHIASYAENYQKTIQLYFTLYLIVTIGFLLLIAFFILRSISKKQADMVKWRIMGFSKGFILKQSILETLIPILISGAIVTIFLLVFQHTYEFLLLQGRTLLTKEVGLQQTIVFSTNVVKENTPTSVSPILSANTYFLSLEVNQLSLMTILTTLVKNSLLLIIYAVLVTAVTDTVYFIKSKNLFRM